MLSAIPTSLNIKPKLCSKHVLTARDSQNMLMARKTPPSWHMPFQISIFFNITLNQIPDFTMQSGLLSSEIQKKIVVHLGRGIAIYYFFNGFAICWCFAYIILRKVFFLKIQFSGRLLPKTCHAYSTSDATTDQFQLSWSILLQPVMPQIFAHALLRLKCNLYPAVCHICIVTIKQRKDACPQPQ